MLRVTWSQEGDTDAVWVEFAVEGEPWRTSPQMPGTVGVHEEILLGLPAASPVKVRVAALDGEELLRTASQSAATLGLPADLENAEFRAWEPTLATTEEWLLGSVDVGDQWYRGPFYVFLLDRSGRIVWYREVPDSRCTMFPRVLKDGSGIAWEANTIYTYRDLKPTFTRATLDLSREEITEISDFNFTWDETEDGTLLYSYAIGWDTFGIRALHPDGTEETPWTCSPWMEPFDPEHWWCMANAIHYVVSTNTALYSMFESGTVVEVDLTTGDVLRQWGNLEGSWAVDPSESLFEWQHYPTFTPEGTLLLSTHVPGQPGEQRAREYALDDASSTLREVWSYGEGQAPYANYAGEAVRLANGNTLLNYGSEGTIREIGPDGQVAWEVAFPGHLVGHQTLVADLYALTAR